MSKKQQMTELAVKFTSFSCNQETEKIGIQISRKELTIEEADEMLTNAQVEATITYDPNSKRDADGQQMMGDMTMSLDLIGETKGFRVDRDKFTFSMQVNKDSVDPGEFSKFAFQTGILKCRRTGDCKEKGGRRASAKAA